MYDVLLYRRLTNACIQLTLINSCEQIDNCKRNKLAKLEMAGQERELQGQLTRRPSRSAATTTFSMEVFDNEVVPASLGSIATVLRVATEIQNERPRVAYLCE